MSFKSVQKKIEGQGHSAASAGAILASATRHASAAAKKANPKLRRVKGGDKSLGRDSMKGRALMDNYSSNKKHKAAFKAGKDY